MKRISVLLAISAFFVFSALSAGAAGESVKINSIDSTIVVREDGVVLVTEKIAADFGASPGHGIYRDIPYAYERKDGSVFYTELEVLSVKDDSGDPYPYEISKNNANLRIRIGDPDVIVEGKKIYFVSYSVKGMLMPFEGYDELYWNAVGDGWTSTIDTATALIIFPEEGVMQAACYKGSLGSKTPCGSNKIEDDRVFFSAHNIGMEEFFTVAVGFRKGMVPLLVAEAPVYSSRGVSITGRDIMIFFAALGVGLFGIILLWWKKGRDIWWKRKALFDPDAKEETMPIGGHETIVAEYESPVGLRPAEVGLIQDETADTLDISATIVDLAVRGYLKITEIPKQGLFGKTDYQLTKLKEADETMLGYEKELFTQLFTEKGTAISELFNLFTKTPPMEKNSVLLSGLKDKFYNELKKVKKLLYEESVSKKIFVANPDGVRNKHRGFAILAIMVSGFLMVGSAASGLGLLVASFVYLIGVSYFMPQRTAYGRELYRQVRGYKLFVSNTEKYRQPFFEKENTFMQILPYAMVFKVTDKLAKAMEQMGVQSQQPAWYVGHGAFNIGEFGASMDSLSKSLSSTMASAPGGSGSGGGGGAGGGGGGGGGGGW